MRITLNLSSEESGDDAGEESDTGESPRTTQVEVPFTLVPRGGKQCILVNGTTEQQHTGTNPVLIQAVVRGAHWRKQLRTGPAISIKEFAKEQGVTSSYLMRLLRVSFLAPDIIEAILDGRQPATMTLERFRRPVPLEWSKQRQLFGFPAR